MQNARFYPDIITHTSVVDAYVKRGDVASALQYFEQNVKVKPDVIIFTSLLDGVARLGDSQLAVSLLDGMEQIYKISPDVNCWIKNWKNKIEI